MELVLLIGFMAVVGLIILGVDWYGRNHSQDH